MCRGSSNSVGRIGDLATPENVVRFLDPLRASGERSFVQCRYLLILAHVVGRRDAGSPKILRRHTYVIGKLRPRIESQYLPDQI